MGIRGPRITKMAYHECAGIILVAGDLGTAASGPNEVVRRLSTWLVNHGYDVTVVGTWRGRHPPKGELGRQYGHAKLVLHRRFLRDTWHFAPGILRFAAHLLLSKKRYVIEVHSVWLFNGIILCLLAVLKRWRYFVTLHGNLRPVALGKGRTLKRLTFIFFAGWWLRHAAGIIALNEREASEARQILPDARIHVIDNAIILHPCALSSSRSKELLFLGRINPIKNLESLIEAFGKISSQFPEWGLIVVGPAVNPEYLAELKSRCAALDIHDRVSFHDAAYGKDKESRLLTASLFVLTSWSEGQPLAALEAMAHGLPILVSDQCNIDVPANCGRVCGCAPDEIAEGLKEMLTMPEHQLREMGSNALSLAREKFSENVVFEKRISLYFSDN